MHLQQLLLYFFIILFSVLCLSYLQFVTFVFQWNMVLPLWSRHELLLLEYFLFDLNVFIFLYYYKLWFLLSSLLLWLLSLLKLSLLFLPSLLPLFSFSISMLLFFIILVLYHSISYRCINQIFLNFKRMTWHKFYIKTLRLYQCHCW